MAGLAKLPNDTIIDGEVVAFDEEGRPSFNALQNYGSAPAPVVFYVFRPPDGANLVDQILIKAH